MTLSSNGGAFPQGGIRAHRDYARLARVAPIGEDVVSFMLRFQRAKSRGDVGADGAHGLELDGEVVG